MSRAPFRTKNASKPARRFASLALACIAFAGQALASESPAPTSSTAMQGGEALVLASAAATGVRYDLGAVVDVRQAGRNGLTVLAVTPGGAADRLGLRAGDQLRSVNGRALLGSTRPAAVLEEALVEADGALRVEVFRDGRTLVLSGRAEPIARAGAVAACGFVSASAGVVPRTQNIFRAEITQIDGRSTPLQRELRHRVGAGKHVLVVREFIDESRLNNAQLAQIERMKRQQLARAYKTLVVDVPADRSVRIGARLLKDRLDAASIRDNAYWEPVVWETVAERCR